MGNEGIRFGTIRKYCSLIDRVSICMHESACYENYRHISLVPAEYDELYLYGFGIVAGEFESGLQDAHEPWKSCIEIRLSKAPRTDIL